MAKIPVFNLPRPADPPLLRYTFLEEMMFDVFGSEPFDMLEIGVDTGDFARVLYQSDRVHPARFVGIDPYFQRDEQYERVKHDYASWGYDLVRARSVEYWQDCDDRFDCIYVDALHDYMSSFEDMAIWFFRLPPGGVMIVDDYGIVVWPEKTKAVNDFLEIARPLIGAYGYRSHEICTPEQQPWFVPITKTNVILQVGPEQEPQIKQKVLDDIKAVLATGKRPHIHPS